MRPKQRNGSTGLILRIVGSSIVVDPPASTTIYSSEKSGSNRRLPIVKQARNYAMMLPLPVGGVHATQDMPGWWNW